MSTTIELDAATAHRVLPLLQTFTEAFDPSSPARIFFPVHWHEPEPDDGMATVRSGRKPGTPDRSPDAHENRRRGQAERREREKYNSH